jgi:FkbM family methyltransferase
MLFKTTRIYKAVFRIKRRLFNKEPTRNFEEFFIHTKKLGFYPGTVLDVGAADGTPAIQSAFTDAYFVWVEPLKEFISMLESLKSKYTGEVHNCALMAVESEGSIFKTDDLLGSSMIHSAEKQNRHVSAIEVKTLDGMFSARDLPEPYLLKVDCQGGDYQVVLGGKEVLKKCELVLMEISFFKFWGDRHPEPLEILNYMDEQGFVIYDILDGLFRPLDGALGQVDIVFVKKDGMFRANHKWSA